MCECLWTCGCLWTFYVSCFHQYALSRLNKLKKINVKRLFVAPSGCLGGKGCRAPEPAGVTETEITELGSVSRMLPTRTLSVLTGPALDPHYQSIHTQTQFHCNGFYGDRKNKQTQQFSHNFLYLQNKYTPFEAYSSRCWMGSNTWSDDEFDSQLIWWKRKEKKKEEERSRVKWPVWLLSSKVKGPVWVTGVDPCSNRAANVCGYKWWLLKYENTPVM